MYSLGESKYLEVFAKGTSNLSGFLIEVCELLSLKRCLCLSLERHLSPKFNDSLTLLICKDWTLKERQA